MTRAEACTCVSCREIADLKRQLRACHLALKMACGCESTEFGFEECERHEKQSAELAQAQGERDQYRKALEMAVEDYATDVGERGFGEMWLREYLASADLAPPAASEPVTGRQESLPPASEPTPAQGAKVEITDVLHLADANDLWAPLRPVIVKLSEHASRLRSVGLEPEVVSHMSERGLEIAVRPKPSVTPAQGKPGGEAGQARIRELEVSRERMARVVVDREWFDGGSPDKCNYGCGAERIWDTEWVVNPPHSSGCPVVEARAILAPEK
ncbi:MAG TPA: hypothetical protein VEA41_21905 [Salinarimonas sp.]|nr:hypothetical protein [Salinarimonas sp.]